MCENSQNHFLAIIQTIIESNWSEHENHQYHKRRLKLIICLYLKVRDIYKLLKQQDFRDEFITILYQVIFHIMVKHFPRREFIQCKYTQNMLKKATQYDTI